MTPTSDRRERYATAIHDAMETDLSLVDQDPAYQALIARAAEAAEALADAEQNRQFLTTLANLGIATHRLDRIRDAARLHRQQLLGTSELYSVIEADDEPEQCPRSEFDGYGLQCQKPAGHNLCTFEEQPAAVSAVVEPPADQTTPSHRAGLRNDLTAALGSPDQADRALAVLYREWPWLRAEAEDAAPPADQTALRDRIAEALISWTYRGKEPDPNVGILETVRANAYSRADAVLAVLPDPADRAAVLREAIDIAREEGHRIEAALGIDAARGARSVAYLLRKQLAREQPPRRMADETATTETQLGAAVAEADAERLATLTDCPNSRAGGLHCGHYQEGDGPCCNCKRPNWCPEGGVA